jgi:hypothetical protein
MWDILAVHNKFVTVTNKVEAVAVVRVMKMT